MNLILKKEDKLILGDCLEKLKELPDESIDSMITDPPYGISFMGKDWDSFNEVVDPQGVYAKEKGFKKLPRQKTTGMTEFFVPIWKECFRVLKSGAFAFVMSSPRADVLSKQINCLQEAGFRVDFTPIYWTYASGFPKGGNLSKKADKRLGEETKFGKHPTQKPIKVIERIIIASSNENDLILDLFSGSGTTAVASKKFKRKYIGIEKEQKYVDIANKRLNKIQFLSDYY